MTDLGFKVLSEQILISLSENVGNSWNTISYRLLRLKNTSMRARACADVRPDHAGEQHVSFAIMVARKT